MILPLLLLSLQILQTTADPVIVGGSTADPLEWRWQVRLSIVGPEGSFMCGGSLISEEWVVTARHCVCDGAGQSEGSESCSSPLYFHPMFVTAHVGDYDRVLFNTSEEDQQDITASEIYVHDNLLDAALIRLSSPVRLSEHVSIIPLANANPAEGENVWATGWGVITPANMQLPSLLQEIELTVMASCSTNDDRICVNVPGATSYQNVCFGDSGGPLVMRQRDTTYSLGQGTAPVWHLVGIASVTINSNLCTLPTGYGGYVSVFNILSWISEHVDLKSPRECHTFDDPHMRTFDGTMTDYHATCEFIYTKPCTSLNPALEIPDFEVFGQHDKISAAPYFNPNDLQDIFNGWWPSNTKLIGIRIGTDEITLTRNSYSPDIQVNGQVIDYSSLPTTLSFGTFFIDIHQDDLNPYRINIDTSFGLTIYHRSWGAGVHLNDWLATYTQGELCGACGQHDYIQNDDDFTWADDTTSFNRILQDVGWYYVPETFYSPYVPQPLTPLGCTLDPRIDVIENNGKKRKKRSAKKHLCSGKPYEKAKRFCSIINDAEGPFSICYDQKDRTQAYDACINDMCLNSTFGCPNLEGYAINCGRFGEVGPWRIISGCTLDCPAGQIYSTIASRECTPTCFDPSPCPDLKPNKRGKKFIRGGVFEEGCVCIPGLVWDGKKCVEQSACVSEDSDAAIITSSQKCDGIKKRKKKMRCLADENNGNSRCQGLFGKKKERCLDLLVVKKMNKGKKSKGPKPRKMPDDSRPLGPQKKPKNGKKKNKKNKRKQ